MAPPITFIDANVIVSKTLRDWTCLLRDETSGGLFTLVTSEDALTEARHSLRKIMPDAAGDSIQGIMDAVRRSLDDVVTSFPSGISFPGSDKHDRHIHAAAKECGARYLISQDAGFSAINPDELPYEVHTSDSFFLLVASNDSGAVDRVIQRQLQYLKTKTQPKPLADALKDAGCPLFAECVCRHLREMSFGNSTHGIAQELLDSLGGEDELTD